VVILYKIQIHPAINSEDLPTLPEQLKVDFALYQLVLAKNPQKPSRLLSHNLTGNLSGYRAIEVGWSGNYNAYRLVYRVYEKPAPRRVLILSFAEHDPAYEKAKARIGKG